jgi:hypothetical protein
LIFIVLPAPTRFRKDLGAPSDCVVYLKIHGTIIITSIIPPNSHPVSQVAERRRKANFLLAVKYTIKKRLHHG